MEQINDLSEAIESMLDLTDAHKFEIKFERLESGDIYVIVSDGFGEISYTREKNCDFAVQSMIESCKDWIDEQYNQDDSEDDELDE